MTNVWLGRTATAAACAGNSRHHSKGKKTKLVKVSLDFCCEAYARKEEKEEAVIAIDKEFRDDERFTTNT